MNKYSYKIVQDEYPVNPRIWDNLATILCRYRDYNLSDKEIPSSYFDDTKNEIEINSIDKLVEYTQYNNKDTKVYYQVLSIYEHGGITMSSYRLNDAPKYSYNDRWDSSVIGIVYTTKEIIKKNFNNIEDDQIEDKAHEIIKQEIKIFNQYLGGDVYLYQVFRNGNLLNSRSSFYSENDAVENALDVIEYYKKQDREKRYKKLKKLIKNNVPLVYREAILNNLKK